MSQNQGIELLAAILQAARGNASRRLRDKLAGRSYLNQAAARIVRVVVDEEQAKAVLLPDDPCSLGYAGPGDPGVDRVGSHRLACARQKGHRRTQAGVALSRTPATTLLKSWGPAPRHFTRAQAESPASGGTVSRRQNTPVAQIHAEMFDSGELLVGDCNSNRRARTSPDVGCSLGRPTRLGGGISGSRPA
jgi:hypothetical protein